MGLAKVETSLDDAQVQSLMHQLRHECDPGYAGQLARLAAADEQAALRGRWHRIRVELRRAVECSPRLRPQRRAGLLARLDEADEVPPPDMVYACEQIRRRATAVDAQLTRMFRATALLDGVHETDVRARFQALREQAPHGRLPRASADERSRWAGLPLDPATRYALARLHNDQVRPGGPPVIAESAIVPVQYPNTVVATGYDPHSQRLEVVLEDGQRLAYRAVPAALAQHLAAAVRPDSYWQLHVSRPEYRYPTAEVAAGFGTRRRCPTCGQWCSLEHQCLGPDGLAPGDRSTMLRFATLPPEAEPSRRDTEYVELADPFQHPDPRHIGLRTFDLQDVAEQLRHDSDGDGLRIPVTAGNDRITITGEVLVRGHGADRVSVIAEDLRCDCADCFRSGTADCRYIRDTLAALHQRLSHEYTAGPAAIGEVAERLAVRRRAERPDSEDQEAPLLHRSTFSYSEEPELFAADVAAALARPPDERVPWRDPWTEPHLIGDGGDQRHFGVELEFDIDRSAPPFGALHGDDTMVGVHIDEREEEVIGYYDEEVEVAPGEYRTKVRFGPHSAVVEEPQLYGDPEPTLQDTVQARVGDALCSAELTSDARQRSYHAAQQDGYTGGAWWNWSYESDGSVDGGEVVSPILGDEVDDWRTLRLACQIIRSNGGRASVRTGSHVTVSAPEFAGDANRVNRLLQVMSYFEYPLETMAAAGHDRAGASVFAQPLDQPPAAGFLSLAQASRRTPRGSVVNIAHLHEAEDGYDNECRVEFRLWDGSLEPGRVQAQVALSVALLDYASRTANDPPLKGSQPLSWITGARPDAPGFAESTRAVREFLDTIATSDGQKGQFAALWAAGRWPDAPAVQPESPDLPPRSASKRA